MPKERFSGEQIAFPLRQAEAETTFGEICRTMGIADLSYLRRCFVGSVRRNFCPLLSGRGIGLPFTTVRSAPETCSTLPSLQYWWEYRRLKSHGRRTRPPHIGYSREISNASASSTPR